MMHAHALYVALIYLSSSLSASRFPCPEHNFVTVGPDHSKLGMHVSMQCQATHLFQWNMSSFCLKLQSLTLTMVWHQLDIKTRKKFYNYCQSHACHLLFNLNLQNVLFLHFWVATQFQTGLVDLWINTPDTVWDIKIRETNIYWFYMQIFYLISVEIVNSFCLIQEGWKARDRVQVLLIWCK